MIRCVRSVLWCIVVKYVPVSISVQIWDFLNALLVYRELLSVLITNQVFRYYIIACYKSIFNRNDGIFFYCRKVKAIANLFSCKYVKHIEEIALSINTTMYVGKICLPYLIWSIYLLLHLIFLNVRFLSCFRWCNVIHLSEDSLYPLSVGWFSKNSCQHCSHSYCTISWLVSVEKFAASLFLSLLLMIVLQLLQYIVCMIFVMVVHISTTARIC